MKKSELKPGVEYACFARPGDARSFANRTYTLREPFKAKLVRVDASEERPERRRFLPGYEMKTVSGVEVDTGKPQVYENVLLYERGKQVGRTRTYPTLILENAGCIYSTWADYKPQKQAQKQAEKQRVARKLAERRARTEAEPAIKRRIEALFEALREFGEVKIDNNPWTRDDRPRRVEVRVSATEQDADEEDETGLTRILVSGEFRYDEGLKGEVLTGVQFTINDQALATLLRVEAVA